MGSHSRNKGKRGEREWAGVLRSLGFPDARRGVQYQGGPESPDVVYGVPGTHCEVKRTEALSVYTAMAQASEECGEAVPYVAHRRNGRGWLVIVRAEDLVDFSRCVINGRQHGENTNN